MIQIKRAYEPAQSKDGYRVLVDRLWPRGIKKEKFAYDEWLKEIAPSTKLRKQFGHDPDHWKLFVTEYKRELRQPEAKEHVRQLAQLAKKKPLTLLYSARNEERNNAVVLKDVIDKELAKSKR